MLYMFICPDDVLYKLWSWFISFGIRSRYLCSKDDIIDRGKYPFLWDPPMSLFFSGSADVLFRVTHQLAMFERMNLWGTFSDDFLFHFNLLLEFSMWKTCILVKLTTKASSPRAAEQLRQDAEFRPRHAHRNASRASKGRGEGRF